MTVLTNHIVRTSYWLLGWQLHQGQKILHRALDQDKIHPQDEVDIKSHMTILTNHIAGLVCGPEEKHTRVRDRGWLLDIVLQ